jgi:hypothetical protein
MRIKVEVHEPIRKNIRAFDDYQLEVVFEKGEGRIFDVKPYLSSGIFTRLRNPVLFGAERVICGSAEWLGGLDLSYDTLYIEGQPISSKVANNREKISQ